MPPWLELEDEPFHRVWQPADLGYDPGWIFQHDVMELSTAVKGRALTRLMEEEEAEFFVYLDPDVFLFNPLTPIAEYMEGASIGLVPHILSAEETDIGVRLTEMSVTEHGIYDLGHLVVRNDANGLAFADWWAKRLDRYCFNDRTRGLFTDQRWVDLVPAIFEGVRILRVPNLDVASWNLFGRTIRQNQPSDPAAFTVDDYPLITYHFSGTGPTGTHTRIRKVFDAGNGATAEIERIYETAIARHGQAELGGLSFGFDAFDDGTPISAQARKLYRDHQDLQRAFSNPFEHASNKLTYQSWLRAKRPGTIDGLIVPQHLMERAFNDLFDESYYLSTYLDAAEAVRNGAFSSALEHYCVIGSRLLYDPNEFFVSSYYFERASDVDRHILRRNVATQKGTLLWHYLAAGLQNGIEPIEFFDSRHYLSANPDLMAAWRHGQITTPLAHFLQFGSREGRDPGPDFNGTVYLERTPAAREMTEKTKATGSFGAFVKLEGVAGRANV